MVSLDLLWSFVVFSESRNSIEAARALGISQPALSNHLARLEESLPQSPFATQGKKKILNEYGQQLAMALRTKLSGTEDVLRSVAQQFLDESQIRLRLAGRRELVSLVLPKLDFRGQIELVYSSGQESVKALESREVDLVLSQRLVSSYEIMAKKLFSDGMKLVAPLSFEGVRKARDPWSLPLGDWPVVTYSRDLDHLQNVFRKVKVQGANVHVSRICDDWLTVARLIEFGQGWGVVPAKHLVDTSLVREWELPSTIEKPLDFFVSYRKELHAMPWFRSLLARIASPG